MNASIFMPRASGAKTPLTVESARRLDWRFLLPDPWLEDVICFADPASSLAMALSALCSAVPIPDRAPADGRRFSVVVLGDASLRSLRAAAEFVAPRGWIYAEFSRSLYPLNGWLEPPGRCRSQLRRLGFDSIVASWHRPTFENSAEIIPLFDPAAGVFAMSRFSPSLRSKLKFGLGSFLHRTNLLPLLVPCFSMLARRSDSDV